MIVVSVRLRLDELQEAIKMYLDNQNLRLDAGVFEVTEVTEDTITVGIIQEGVC